MREGEGNKWPREGRGKQRAERESREGIEEVRGSEDGSWEG